MNELIKIETREDKETVNARDLHEFLGIETRYNDWIVRYVKDFDFQEGADFISHTQKRVSGGTKTDHHITLDMAKELSMLQRNKKGKQARKFFIECEKKLKSIQPLQIQNQLMIVNGQLANRNEYLENKVRILEKQVDFTETVSIGADNSLTVNEFAKLISKRGVLIDGKPSGQNKLFSWLRRRGYLMRSNIPYQAAIDSKLFELALKVQITSAGERFHSVTLVTGKGQVAILKKIRAVEPVSPIQAYQRALPM